MHYLYSSIPRLIPTILKYSTCLFFIEFYGTEALWKGTRGVYEKGQGGDTHTNLHLLTKPFVRRGLSLNIGRKKSWLLRNNETNQLSCGTIWQSDAVRDKMFQIKHPIVLCYVFFWPYFFKLRTSKMFTVPKEANNS